jgi:uncharacterized protein
MKIVLDTNCLLLIISKKGNFYAVFERIKLGEIQLIVSTEIINEYQEILETVFSHQVAEYIVKALLNHPKTILLSHIYYQWNLITADPEDNKFVDAYISGSGDFLVTNDKHFEVVKSIEFPAVNVMNLKEFANILN